MLNYLNETTVVYGNSVNKEFRKKIGQFFTPSSVAKYMGSLMRSIKDTVRILDPGAGTGILTGAICQRILHEKKIKSIHVDLFEADENIIPLLMENLEYISQELESAGKKITYKIFNENFILHHEEFWNEQSLKSEDELYDVIISNPPYKKISKSDPESIAMLSVVHGQPNIYFLFMAMAVKLLKKDGEMIFITPRSFTSGAYFQRFREYFLENVRITNLHLFHSRSDVFNSDKVLQEAIILRATKTKVERDHITVSASSDYNFEGITEQLIPYDSVVDKKSGNSYILIPTSPKETDLLLMMNSWKFNLISLGFKLKTGPVVDFRATEFLREEPSEDTVPLLWANHFNDHLLHFPDPYSKKPQYILRESEKRKLLIKNQNTVLIKRFTSKEENRRIQCVLYYPESFPFEKIGLENHLNYVAKLNGEMTDEEMHGLFALFNSSYVDLYYRILNGSTQVNATEINSIPLPSLNEIKWVGRKLMKSGDYSTNSCDRMIDLLLKNQTEIRSNAV